MTNATGSNNFKGLLGNLMEVIETVVDTVEGKLLDFAEGVDDDEEVATYKLVADLGLSDVLVLNDGDWAVMAVQCDGFDEDIVSVTLDNGESYDMLRTAMVRVV